MFMQYGVDCVLTSDLVLMVTETGGCAAWGVAEMTAEDVGMENGEGEKEEEMIEDER